MRQGHTLLELLVVLTVVAICMVVAIPAVSGVLDWIATDGAAHDVTTALAAARQLAVGQGVPARLRALATVSRPRPPGGHPRSVQSRGRFLPPRHRDGGFQYHRDSDSGVPPGADYHLPGGPGETMVTGGRSETGAGVQPYWTTEH